jgi:hypothetical protein
MGTVALLAPTSFMSEFALSQMDISIALYSSSVDWTSSTRLRSLYRLQKRAWASARHHQGQRATATSALGDYELQGDSNESEEDIEMIGWRTRLVARARAGAQVTTTIKNPKQDRRRTPNPLSTEEASVTSGPASGPRSVSAAAGDNTSNNAAQDTGTTSVTQLVSPRRPTCRLSESQLSPVRQPLSARMLLEPCDGITASRHGRSR